MPAALVVNVFAIRVIYSPWRHPLLRFLRVRELTGKLYFGTFARRDGQPITNREACKVPFVGLSQRKVRRPRHVHHPVGWDSCAVVPKLVIRRTYRRAVPGRSRTSPSEEDN